MKKFTLCLLACTASLFSGFAADAPMKTKWSFKNPFEQKVFIENKGQYEITDKSLNVSEILFGARQDGLFYYFTKDGIWVKYTAEIKRSEEEIEAELKRLGIKEDKLEKEEKEFSKKRVDQFYKMEFVGGGFQTEILSEGQVDQYYTFSPGNKVGFKASAFKKITYKNLYAGVDMEIFFPEDKQGFKYNLILHPGANPNQIQIKYPLNKGLALTSSGDISIKSPFGNFVDHAPIAAEQITSNPIACAFKLQNGIVKFDVANYDLNKGLIIDPWTSTPTFPGSNNAYDVDWDVAGNAYAYGGNYPHQVIKFSPTGAMIWAYTTSFVSSWAYYGDFAVNRASGSIFICDGANPSGSQATKIGTNGIFQAGYGGNPLFQEMWRMTFSRCSNQAVIAGGGTSNPSYTGCYLDTNLFGMTPVNVINSPTGLHDMWGLAVDNSGSAYFGSAQTQVGSAGYDNIIYKVPAATLAPINWQVPEGYQFVEIASVLFTPGPGNGFNGMMASNTNLYTYDSYQLKKWNTATGALVQTVAVNGASQTTMSYGGIAADECDNLFLGKLNTIVQYNAALSPVSTINKPGSVYDVSHGNNSLLYSCGVGFVSVDQLTIPPCAILATTTAVTLPTCVTPTGSATVTVTSGSGPFTITWNTTPVQTGPVASNLAPGMYIASIHDNSCVNLINYDTVYIVGTTIPNFIASSDTVCNGSSATLTASGVTSYTWSPAGSLNTTSGPTVIASPTVTTVYTITGSSGGCNGTTTATVTVNSPPVMTVNSPTICTTTSTTLTATGATTYTWTPGTGLSGTSGPTVTANPSTTTTYTITGAIGSCAATLTSILTVNPLPTITTTITPTCLSTNVTIASLMNTPGGSYSWNTTPVQLTATATNVPAGNYTVTATNTNGCVNTLPVTIVTPTLLSATISNTNNICFGGNSATATVVPAGGTIGYSYLWTGAGAQTTATAINLIAGTYSVTVTDANGCTNTQSATVTEPTAVVPVTSVTNDNCTSSIGSATVTATGGTSPYSFVWSNAQVGATANGLSLNTYTVITTDANLCSVSATAIIGDLPGPTASATLVNNVLCFGGNTGNVSASAVGGGGVYTYLWSNGITTATNSSIIAGSYSVTVTNVNGCTSNASVIVTEPTQLNVNATITVPAICVGQTSTLNTTGSGGTLGYNYLWDNGQTAQSVTVSPLVTTTYTIFITDANGCTNNNSITLIVNPNPVPAFLADPIQACAYACATFTNTTTGASIFSWNFGDGATSSQQDPVHCYNANGLFNVTLTATTNFGCSANTVVNNLVEIYPAAIASAIANPGSVTTLEPIINFYDQSSYAASWNWFFGDPLNGTSSSQNPTYTYPDAGTYLITLAVASANGCLDTTTLTIVVEEEFTIYFPNAFTPNGDGVNDIWFPKGLGVDPSNYNLMIFSRWGEQIFQTTTWGEGWNGKANGGNDCAQIDTYVWKAKVKPMAASQGGKKEYTGIVSLIR